MSVRPARLVAVVTLVGVLTGCGDSGSPASPSGVTREQDCASAAAQLVQATARYLAGFAEGGASPSPDSAASLSEPEWSRAVADLQAFAAANGCEQEQFADEVDAGLRGVEAPTPLARAVLLQIRAGTPRGGPRTVNPAPGDDLAAVAASLAPGSTVQLSAGTYEVSDPLVLLRGVTISGAGRDATVIASTSDDGAALVLSDQDTAFVDVELRAASEQPGPVVLVGPLADLSLERVRVTGGRAGEDGAGGTGVVVAPAPEGEQGQAGPQRRTTVRIADSELTDNQSAGVVVSGTNRVEVLRSSVTGAGQCGVCFLDASDGLVEGSTLVDNAVGVVAAGTSRPAVAATTVRGGEVGVQADERAQPVVQGSTFTGQARAALIATGSATGRFEGNTCGEAPVGVVVSAEAVPYIGENTDCPVVRGQ